MKQKIAVVALDVGGTKIAGGLILDNGEVLAQGVVPTPQESAETSIALLAGFVGQFASAAPKDVVVAGVGAVIPGWVNQRKRTVWAPNIAGWDHVPLHERLEDQVALPVVLDSDRSGYVKGEAWLGSAHGLSDVVFLAVGTGIGAGILAGGEVIHGHQDLAGAVGWLALNPHFKEAYQRMGCFEAEASGQGIAMKGRDLGGGIYDSARRVIEAAAAGDPKAKEILDDVAVYLGMGVANLVSTLNPEMVVLGGGVFQGGTQLLEAVRREFRRWAQPFAAESVRLELSVLGDRAGMFGAARIALDTFGGNHVG